MAIKFSKDLSVLKVVVFVAMVFGFMAAIDSSFKNSDAYQVAVQELQTNPIIKNHMIEQFSYDLATFAGNEMSTSGSGTGEARFTLDISNENQEASVYFHLVQSDHQWQIIEMNMYFQGEEAIKIIEDS